MPRAMVPPGYRAVTISIGCFVVVHGTMRHGTCAQLIVFAIALTNASLLKAFESHGICDPLFGDGISVLRSTSLFGGLGGLMCIHRRS